MARYHSNDQFGDACEVCGSTYSPTDLIDPRSALSDATPVMRDTASAANTALPSSRTSITLMPLACAPVRIGEMWPPHSVNN